MKIGTPAARGAAGSGASGVGCGRRFRARCLANQQPVDAPLVQIHHLDHELTELDLIAGDRHPA